MSSNQHNMAKISTNRSRFDPSLPSDTSPSANALLASCWTPVRLEIRSWLSRNAPPLAELYEGAVRLLYVNLLPGRVRFISHAVREIRNRLPGVISGEEGSQYLHYKNRLDDLAKLWHKKGHSFTLEGT